MKGWEFVNDPSGVPCTNTADCRLVSGAGDRTENGGGSAELASAATSTTPSLTDSGGSALRLARYGGTRLDEITSLQYSTLRQTDDSLNVLDITLELVGVPSVLWRPSSIA
jgi:hypothetical protein